MIDFGGVVMATVQQIHKGREDRPAVIFVHGLGGDAKTTWQSWPQWVGEDSDCDIWSVGYDAAVSAWIEEALPLNRQADQIADLLASCHGLAKRSLVLVGHSMGGLIIKAVMLQGRSKGVAHIQELIERVVAVVFVATPHSGAGLASFARSLGRIFKVNAQVGNIALHDAVLAEINSQFRQLVVDKGLPIHVFAEGKDVSIFAAMPIRFRIGGVRVVNETSADPALPGVVPIFLSEDHVSIAKPKSRQTQIHSSLLAFLARIVGVPFDARSRGELGESRNSLAVETISESHFEWLSLRSILAAGAFLVVVVAVAVEVPAYCPMARIGWGQDYSAYVKLREFRKETSKDVSNSQQRTYQSQELRDLRSSCNKWPDALHEMGVAKYHDRDLPAARTELKAALNYWPSLVMENRIRNTLISVFVAMGDLPAAESEAEAQYERSDGEGGVIYNLPLIKLKLRKFDRADELFAGALARNDITTEGRAFANFGRATAAVLNGNVGASAVFASAAICDFPELRDFVERKGQLNFGKGDFEAFWVTLNSAVGTEAYNILQSTLQEKTKCPR